MGARPLTAPFLELDLDRCTESVCVPLDELMAQGAVPPQSPAGFIFHMSRTGSTVAGVMLRATGECAFVSEPLAVNGLFYRTNDDEDELLEAQLRFILDWFTMALGGQRRVVFKFASWLTLHLDRFQQWWPAVPTAFMYRESVEVASAIVDKTPFLFRRAHMRTLLESPPPNEPEFGRRLYSSLRDRVDYTRNCAYVEFVVRFLGAICEPAASAYRAKPSMLSVCYASLIPQVLDELAAAFGLEATDRQRQQMLEAARYDVKALEGNVVFRNDSTLKRQMATRLMQDLCDRHVQPSIDVLRRPR